MRAIALVLGLILATTSAQALWPPAYNARGLVWEVSESGVFQFYDKDQPYRLFGVHPDPDGLRDLILRTNISCLASGGREVPKGKPIPVLCREWSVGRGKEGRSIQKLLIERGAAVEDCAESMGHFGTCDERWSPDPPGPPSGQRSP